MGNGDRCTPVVVDSVRGARRNAFIAGVIVGAAIMYLLVWAGVVG